MKAINFLSVLVISSLVLSGCSILPKKEPETHSEKTEPAAQRENTSPVPPKITRDGKTVRIEMTAQVTDVEISKGVTYNAWTFNGTVPGPVIRVKEGDTLLFTLKNKDPNLPHSMDFHAVHAAPDKKFANVMPRQQNTFTYSADTPGAFMYHCGTDPVLQHVANGMFGMIIVEPKNGYPTDATIDREYVIVQSEWYQENDFGAMTNGMPEYNVFNGNDYALKEQPLHAKAGERIRLYVLNAGPNEVSSFHVIGTTLDTVYLDGNPRNRLHGLQTVQLSPSAGAVIELTVTEEGNYPFISHQLRQASKGAKGIIRVTR
jgi:nitrite reductase (NO-forming)